MKKSKLGFLVLLSLLLLISTLYETPVDKSIYTHEHTTNDGTIVRIEINFDESAKTGEPYTINVTITLVTLGVNIEDIHDIEVGISAEVSGRLFSPYYNVISRLGTILNTNINTTNASFCWVPDSFWMQLNEGQSVVASLKYVLRFREKKPMHIDPSTEIVAFFGNVTVYFEKQSPYVQIFYALIIALIGMCIFLAYFILRKRMIKSSKEITESRKETTVVIKEKVLLRCPYCGGLVEQGEKNCPHCNAKL